jgi:gliding motility-associated-like protein
MDRLVSHKIRRNSAFLLGIVQKHIHNISLFQRAKLFVVSLFMMLVSNSLVRAMLIEKDGNAAHKALYNIEKSSDYNNTLNADGISSTKLILIPCNGTPVSGIIKISHAIGCKGINFKLEITANAYSFAFDGLSYQWQQSDNGIDWIDLVGATNPNSMDYTTNQTSYFRLSVSCANSGETGYSNVVIYLTQDCEAYNINEYNTVKTCSALFYDSGGANGNYQNNEDHTISFCSASGEKMRVEFLNFDTQDNNQTGRNHFRYDILYVYDGPDVNSPPLFEFSGLQSLVNLVPIVVSSGECITFRFRSDNNTMRSGWEAVVTCTSEENRVASQFCETAPNICNLDGYYGTTSNFYNVESVGGQLPGVFFPFLVLDNASFITFVADAAIVELDIWIGNCTPANCGSGREGIQLGVIAGADCVFSSILADYGYGLIPGVHRLNFTGLTAGEIYYLVVDGYNCSNCQYLVNALSGIALAQIDITNAIICEGDEITVTASGGTDYMWSDPLGNVISTERSITVSETGIYHVSITGGNTFCPEEVILSSAIFTEFCCPEIPEPGNPNNPIICVGDDIPTLFVDDIDEEYLLNWYDSPVGGNLIGENTHIYLPPINSEAGVYVYYVEKQLKAFDCVSDRIAVVLNIKEYSEAIFDTLSNYCIGKELPVFSQVSTNNISGTWSPEVYSVEFTEYIFTPFQDQCSFTLSIHIDSENPVVPDFDEYGAHCSGDEIQELPATSNNGIKGTWMPELNNLSTTTYYFIPEEYECAEEKELTITILVNSASEMIVEQCDEFYWDGERYTNSGVYQKYATNSVGCDSVITLNLKILSSDYIEELVYACDNYIRNGITYRESGNFSYSGINSVGCDSIATIKLEISDSGIFIPNIFRANGNGLNDCFRIKLANNELSEYSLSIFDRWGNMVFTSNSVEECWDGRFGGKECAVGVYVYILLIKDPGCGLRKITGDVTLVR